ncbi:hypothetical protein CQ12_40050 [Bradyrhizobium jicamae]|uniref:Uncharacterized protein n=1 Tax=Bradyrhizobium jicamae TaxID=280332 RepID=A0A0R3KQW6_9BRAD|nr:hypothetical protein [Bradyrhizobium jicamae]KRQ95330.1 hypothetical protein CQ12_40050 [Bradyrhizobium jicamae]
MSLAGCQTAAERQQALIAKLNRSCDQLGYTSGPQRLECLRTMAQIEQANEAAEEARTQRAAAALQAAGKASRASAPAPPRQVFQRPRSAEIWRAWSSATAFRGVGMIWLKRLLMVLGALWLISIFAGAVILWGNDWRFGAAASWLAWRL